MKTQSKKQTNPTPKALSSLTHLNLRSLIVAMVLTVTLFNTGYAQIVDSSKMPSPVIKTFRSEILGGNRTIFIQTPAKMKATDQYPVLYLLDGESFINMVSGQVQYLSESYKIIPSMIIVGIKSNDRFKDLTPTHSIIGNDGKPDSSANSPFKTSGGGDKFLQFLKQELFPYVESNYPTAPYRILYGHSLGGLLTVHALINQPDLFNAYIAVSPSFQWDSEALLKKIPQSLGKQQANKLLFLSDANEDARFHQNLLFVDSVIRQRNIPALNSKYMFYPGESHISEPVKAFYDGIRHIYPSWHLPYNTSAFRKSMNSRIIIDHYNKLSETYHYKVLAPQDEINQISKFLANDPNRMGDALELLKWNALNYPNSAMIYEITGDTYLKMKDTKNALLSYQRAVELAPGDENLKQKMKAVGQ